MLSLEMDDGEDEQSPAVSGTAHCAVMIWNKIAAAMDGWS